MKNKHWDREQGHTKTMGRRKGRRGNWFGARSTAATLSSINRQPNSIATCSRAREGKAACEISFWPNQHGSVPLPHLVLQSYEGEFLLSFFYRPHRIFFLRPSETFTESFPSAPDRSAIPMFLCLSRKNIVWWLYIAHTAF